MDYFYNLIVSQMKKNPSSERGVIVKVRTGNLYDIRIGGIVCYRIPMEIRPGDTTFVNLYRVGDIVRVSRTMGNPWRRFITGYDNTGTSESVLMEI